MAARRATNADAPDHLVAGLDGQSAAKDENFFVHVWQARGVRVSLDQLDQLARRMAQACGRIPNRIPTADVLGAWSPT